MCKRVICLNIVKFFGNSKKKEKNIGKTDGNVKLILVACRSTQKKTIPYIMGCLAFCCCSADDDDDARLNIPHA